MLLSSRVACDDPESSCSFSMEADEFESLDGDASKFTCGLCHDLLFGILLIPGSYLEPASIAFVRATLLFHTKIINSFFIVI